MSNERILFLDEKYYHRYNFIVETIAKCNDCHIEFTGTMRFTTVRYKKDLTTHLDYDNNGTLLPFCSNHHFNNRGEDKTKNHNFYNLFFDNTSIGILSAHCLNMGECILNDKFVWSLIHNYNHLNALTKFKNDYR